MKRIMSWILPVLMAVLAGCAGNAQKRSLPESPMPKANTVAFVGSLPCRHCSRIDTRLVLSGLTDADAAVHTFTIDAKYIGHEGPVGGRQYAGSWDRLQGTPADPSAEVINLLDQQPESQVMFHFQQIDSHTLELIDGQLQRYENGEGLRLYLQPDPSDSVIVGASS